MSQIEFDPDSAPLSGAITPSIGDINQLNETHDRVVWRPDGPTPESVKLGAMAFPLALSAALLAYAALYFILPDSTPVIRTTPVGAHVAAPLSTASTIYAVIKKPTVAEYEALNAAVDAGAQVTLICPKNITVVTGAPEIKFQRFGADETEIISEGYLLNGFQWYPLPVDKKGRTGQ